MEDVYGKEKYEIKERKYRARMENRNENIGEKYADSRTNFKEQFQADQNQHYTHPKPRLCSMVLE